MYWLGVDVGGTFTDLVLYNDKFKAVEIAKVPSTPHDQSEAILQGIARMKIPTHELHRFVHGTTVATNTALELNGAKVAVLTTEGHEDVLTVGLGNRMNVYNIRAASEPSMLPRGACIGVRERLYANGNVRTPVDLEQVKAIAQRLKTEQVDAVAICFLHSYVNPAHENQCAEILGKALPGVVICTSSSVLPEYREYERFSTTALNAYVAPRMQRYLGELEKKLKNSGVAADPLIMASNGGVLPLDAAEKHPILTMLSGPAGGVIAAARIGKGAGTDNLITFDMGGTSTDVCVVQDGQFEMTTTGKVGSLPVKIRQIDIHTVATGGGSLAEVRHGGFLSVGPRSAGSLPGPVCYGRGGIIPAITDANVVLGRLSANRSLGGDITLDRAAARSAVAALGETMRLDIESMAEGILKIATVQLAAAIKEVSVMKGLDARDFALLPYGGAGPLHAAEVADHLGMDQVLVPPMPGNFSALGLLLADVRRDFVKTQVALLGEMSEADIADTFEQLVRQAVDNLNEAGFAKDHIDVQAHIDMRYAGQSFELSVPVDLKTLTTESLNTGFEEVYRSRYANTTSAPIEIVNYRLAAWGKTEKPTLFEKRQAHDSVTSASPDPLRFDDVYFEGSWHSTPVYQRDDIQAGVCVSGPALIEEQGTTTVLPPGWSAKAASFNCLMLSRSK